MEQIITYILLALMLIFSVMTVTSGRILRSAVYLLTVLVATAAIYFIMQYQFLAAVQITLYAGGIVVLIIFSILLTHHIEHRMENPVFWKAMISALAALGAVAMIAWVLKDAQSIQNVAGFIPPKMEDIGMALLSYGKQGYVLPFEVISVLLLAAMIGAIAVAKPALLQFKNKNFKQDDQ